MRVSFISAVCLVLGGMALAQSTSGAQTHAPDAGTIPNKQSTTLAPAQPTATFQTSMGDIHCTLFPDKAPETVANFIGLATGKKQWTNPKTGKVEKAVPLYDGTTFHRVIPDFMIQGGDPAGNGMGGPGYQFEDETRNSPHKFDTKGKLAMANAGPNTNGSQFFITVAPTTWLTGKHTIFGEVVEGQEIVDKISSVPRSGQDRPVKEVVLQSVSIEQA